MPNPDIEISLVCTGFDCNNKGGSRLLDSLQRALTERGNDTPVRSYECFGNCHEAPVIVLHPKSTFYTRVQGSDIGNIADHIAGGSPVDRLIKRDDQPLQDLMRDIISSEITAGEI